MPRNRRVFALAGLVALVAFVAYVALPYHPAYQEWRVRGLGASELTRLQAELPESPIVLYHVGAALHREGRSADAIAPLQRAAQLDQHSVRIREALIQAQLALGQTRPTFELLRRFLETHPDTPEAYHMMGRFLLGVQTYSRAVAVLDEATRRFPEDGTAWTLLASARQAFGDTRGAQDAILRAVALRPKDAEAWLLNARILKERGVPSQAHEAYIKAVHLAPEDVELKAEAADFIARQGGDPQAIIFAAGVARRVLQQSPGHVRASGALGLALAERSEWDEAEPLLTRALEQNPNDLLVLRTLVRLAQQKRDGAALTRWSSALKKAQAYRDEEKQIQDALGVRPKDPDLLRRMAQHTGRGGDALKSLRFHAIAAGTTPDTAPPLLAAARDLQIGGYPSAARQFALRAREISQSEQERAEAERLLTLLPE